MNEQKTINHIVKLLEKQVEQFLIEKQVEQKKAAKQKKAVEQQEREAKGLYYLVD